MVCVNAVIPYRTADFTLLVVNGPEWPEKW
jgi:hypothetical protein